MIVLSSILGDIVGSRFQYENHRSEYFDLLDKSCYFTDDSIIELSILQILESQKKDFFLQNDNQEEIKNYISDELRAWCCCFLNRNFSPIFFSWIIEGNNQPYFSRGNNALLRIAPIFEWGKKNFLAYEDIKKLIFLFVEITHNHPENKSVINFYIELLWKLDENKNISLKEKKEMIQKHLKEYQFPILTIEQYKIDSLFTFDMKRTLGIIFSANLEAENYEEVFYKTVSVGGVSDTYCAIAGVLAALVWGFPQKYKQDIESFFRDEEKDLLKNLE
jgi:type I restriction enzyme M protein